MAMPFLSRAFDYGHWHKDLQCASIREIRERNPKAFRISYSRGEFPHGDLVVGEGDGNRVPRPECAA